MSVESPPQVSALPPTWFIGFRRARLWPLSASRPRSTDLLPPSALPLTRSLPAAFPARPAAGRLPANAGHRAAVVVLRINRGNSEDSVGLHQSERRWVLDYITAIGVSLPYLKTRERYPSLYSIGAIEDLETFDYYPLRGNFVPTSATCSASPSLSGTHCGREHLCSAEGKKEVCQPSEAATGVFSRLPGVHRTHQCRRSRHRRVHSCCRSWTNARKDSGHCRWRVNVHRLSQWAERYRKIVIPPPQAPAERQTSGLSMLASLLYEIPLPRLLAETVHWTVSLSLTRCRDSEPSPEKLSGTTPFLRCAPGWLRSDQTIGSTTGLCTAVAISPRTLLHS